MSVDDEDQVFHSVLNALNADFKDSLTSQEQLKLYGWYKVARSESVAAAGLFSITAKAKCDAYQAVAHLSKREAIVSYIQFVQSKARELSLEDISETCAVALLSLQPEIPNAKHPTPIVSPSEEAPAMDCVLESPKTPTSSSWVSKYLPQPMVPRGQLDTTLGDLLFALISCIGSPKVGSCKLLLEGSTTTLLGLSVRSLFDLYLSVQKFPQDSEIIISPAISIPGMLEIIRNHGLKIVAVDLPDATTVAVNVPAIREKITSKTVAIMIVNVFGNECADTAQRKELNRLAQMHNLALLLDAAESFSGALPNTEDADVSFVSFGLIKTTTAVSGGVAVIRNEKLAQQMRRRQETYDIQSQWEYARRILKAMLLHGILSSPLIYGMLHDVIIKVWDFDAVVYRCQRGFPSSATLSDIRKRPSSALIRMLHRCLHTKRTGSTVAQRIVRAESLDRRGLYERPIFTSWCTHWLYPVLGPVSGDSNTLCQTMRDEKRVDATKGSLIAVDDTVPLTNELMDRVLYVPLEVPPDRLQLGPHSLTRIHEYVALVSIATLFWFLRRLFLFCLRLTVYFVSFVYFMGWALQRITGRYYVQSSSAFAEYSFLFDDEERENSKRPPLNIVRQMPELTVPNIERGKGSVALLTGSTGFVGSMLLRDLLWFRKELNVVKIVLICRSKKGISALERVDSLLDNSMFSFLDSRERRDLVEVVEVDLTQDLGNLDAKSVSTLRRVTHVFHCAAAVSFTQSLRDAARSNISATLNLQQYVASLGNNAKFVHVSTAFIRGKRPSDFVHDEKLCEFGPFDPYTLYKSMLGSQYQAAMAMDQLGFVNTYTFSKSVCEHLLVRSNPDVIIIRPAIVGPAIETPFEGWYGNSPSTLIAAACLFFKFQWNVWSFGHCNVPCLPVDVLSKFIISKTMRDCSDGESNGSSTDDTDSFDKVSEFSLDSSRNRTSSIDFSARHSGAPNIFNAAWDHESHGFSQFMWSDYAAGVAQSGAILNHFNRLRATVALYAATVVIPHLGLSDHQFAILHEMVVMFPLKCFAFVGSSFGSFLDVRHLQKLSTLPLLFAPFSGSNYKFQSGLLPPDSFCGRRYLSCCVSAADHYIRKQSRENTGKTRRLKSHVFAGKKAFSGNISNLWWALTQPGSTLATKVVALVLRLVLRRSFNAVSVDLLSFSSIRKFNEADCIILAPTHRSFFDFLILYFLCFEIPELQLGWPLAAAAKEFESIPVVGFAMKTLGAFFVQRGRSDPMLAENIPRGEESCPSYLVFIEGTRSRDGRFGKPKTGVIRCLHKEKTLILPLSISYEKVAEQQTFNFQARGISSGSMTLKGLLHWLFDVYCGRVSLGNVHVEAAEPILIEGNQVDWTSVAIEIQTRQTKGIRISDYHVNSISNLLGIHDVTVRTAMDQLGVRWFPSNSTLTMPSNRDECLYNAMQVSFLLWPLFLSDASMWSEWLHHTITLADLETTRTDNGPLKEIRSQFLKLFSASDHIVDQVLKTLEMKRLATTPAANHIVQLALKRTRAIPISLLYESACRRVQASRDLTISSSFGARNMHLQEQTVSGGEELGFWGYRDSRFVVCQNGSDIMLEGDRYHISGKRLPGLLPFMSKETMVEVHLENEAFSESEFEYFQESRITQKQIETLSNCCGKVSLESKERFRHGTGHSLGDVLAARQAKSIRIPDCVVWPELEKDVQALVSLAKRNCWCIIPFGGGTNVSQATRCPSLEQEPRPIISLDTKLLSEILSIDGDNMLAEVQAGVTGKQLELKLNKQGFTMGHEPDSLEFSTLGGWIATKASGMKRNKYGNIEDIVVGVSIASADGELKRASYGRESCGLVLKDLFIGSEGCLGIITSAQIKIFPLPAIQEHDCALLEDFQSGTQFLNKLFRQRSLLPASVRLLDNAHFRLGQALRPKDELSISKQLQWIANGLFFHTKSFKVEKVVLVCFVFEGSTDEVRLQKASVSRTLGLFNHLRLGQSIGKSSYDMTFTIAYLRDFAMTYWYLGESLETFVPWTLVEDLVSKVKKRIFDEHATLMLPGLPFIGCRITQLYHDGVCVYIYICMNFRGVDDPEKSFSAIEQAARDEILACGGSISHHHGVGKIRAPFLEQVDGQGSLSVSRKLKKSLDPLNIFGARNGRFCDAPLGTENTAIDH